MPPPDLITHAIDPHLIFTTLCGAIICMGGGFIKIYLSSDSRKQALEKALVEEIREHAVCKVKYQELKNDHNVLVDRYNSEMRRNTDE